MSLPQYCPWCFIPTYANGICPNCGRNLKDSRVKEHHLPPGEPLSGGRYRIGLAMGQGGFGITYRALDTRLNRVVAIKEYFPTSMVTRTSSHIIECYTESQRSFYERSRDLFLREARTLARLDHIDEIVNVLDFFPENNTAYIVMEFLEGETLSQKVQREGPIQADLVLGLLKPVIAALGIMHTQGIIHRDISPDNLMILSNGKVKLLDFGCAREVDTSGLMSVMLKPGYAPIEQYFPDGKQGPWTDIYALCGTVYFLITGNTPAASLTRRHGTDSKLLEWNNSVGRETEIILTKGLEPEAKDRWPDVASLYHALYHETLIISQSKALTEPDQHKIGIGSERVERNIKETANTIFYADKKNLRWIIAFAFAFTAAVFCILFGLFLPEDYNDDYFDYNKNQSERQSGQNVQSNIEKSSEKQDEKNYYSSGQSGSDTLAGNDVRNESEPDNNMTAEDELPIEEELNILWNQIDALPIEQLE